MNKREDEGGSIRPSAFVDQKVPQAVDGVGVVPAGLAIEGDAAMDLIGSQAWKLQAANVEQPPAAYVPAIAGTACCRATRTKGAGCAFR